MTFSAGGLWASDTCSIEVDEVLYHYGECQFSEEQSSYRNLVIDVRQKTEDGASGYWARLVEQENGSFKGLWSGASGAASVHSELGRLERNGNCWVGEQARICLGVQTGDVPNYRIVRQQGSPLGRTVEARVNGTRYMIDHHSWDLILPSDIGETSDLDGDGYPETIVHLSRGGNGDPGAFTLISYHGDGFFSVVNDEPISSGWGGVEVINYRREKIIRVNQIFMGVDGYEDQETKVDYALRDGKLVRLAEHLNVGKTVALAELTAEEVRKDPGQKKSLEIDLNFDGDEDNITCSYWGRWGELSCNISYAGSNSVSDASCKRLAVLPQVISGSLVIDCGG